VRALLALFALGCSTAPPPVKLPACADGGLEARPLALLGDRVSDRLEAYAADTLAPDGCVSVDFHPEYIDEPFDLALSPDQKTLYVVMGHANGYSRGTLLKLRLSDGAKLAELTLGEEPSMIALSKDGSRAYVSLFRNLAHPRGPWTDPGALVVVDTGEMRLLSTTELCAAALGVALDEPRGRVWVACLGDDQVAAVDVGGTPRVFTMGPLLDGTTRGKGPAYVATDGARVYVTAQTSSDLWMLDPASGDVTARVAFESGAFPQRLARLPGDLLLVALDGAETLAAISTSGAFVADRVMLPGVHPQGIAVSPDGLTALVTDENDLMNPGRLARVRLDGLGMGGARLDGTAPAAVFPQAVIWIAR
jgi:DNA-binding beta-propeller fold protein YncE